MPPKPPSPRLTHFLCLPLITPASRPQLQTSLNAFREKVTKPQRENPDGIPEAAVRPLGTLHLTLGVMSLLSQERVDSALALLRSLNLKEMLLAAANGDSKEKQQLRITLKGLKSMHSPSSTSTLFAPPVSSPTLFNFCQQLKDAFTKAELLVPDDRPLLLHATVINTIYVPGVKGKGGHGGHGKRKAKLTFDASELLEDWEDFIWMEDVRVERVDICRMGAVKGEDDEEAYGVEGSVDMP